MRIAAVLLLALAIVAAPAVQAFACQCGDQAAAAEPTSCCCCGDAATCNCCCQDEPAAPVRTTAGCTCSHDAPQASESPSVDLPAPVLVATLPAIPVSAPDVALAVRPASAAPDDPHPEVRAPLLL
jgi:hypothetical protein